LSEIGKALSEIGKALSEIGKALSEISVRYSGSAAGHPQSLSILGH